MATLFIATILAACNATPDEPTASPVPSDVNGPFYQNYKLAIRAEASDEQIAALKKAWETNELTYETVNDLVENSFACLEEAGIEVVRKEPSELGPDYKIPNYATGATVAGLTESQVLALTDDCIDHNSYFAEMALQAAPQATEARDERLLADLPAILDCLNAHGVAATADETPAEIRAKVVDLLNETNKVDAPVACYDDFSP